MAAEKTTVTEILLLAGKGPLFTARCKFLQRRFQNIAQPPLRLDKKLTAKGIAAVLDKEKTGALFTVRANRVFAHNVISYYRVEVADVYRFAAVVAPAVEYPAQKFAVLLRCN